MLTRKNLLRKCVIALCVIVAGVVTGLVVLQFCGVTDANAEVERRDVARTHVPKMKVFDFDAALKQAKAEEAAKRLENPVKQVKIDKRPRRKLKTYRWESVPDTRARIWNIPEDDHDEATLTAFLRVCIAEADGEASDCIGIWQVIRNNRRRTCARSAPGGKRITQCDENGETFLSSLRRHQRHVLGYIPLRNRRAAWISKMTLDCENPPEEYTGTLNQWDARYFKRCNNAITLGRHLMKGELPPSKPGHSFDWLPGRPITWGGRCESGKASCDDKVACSRGLIRLETDTLNAFWRRRAEGEGPDPVCVKLGYE